MSKKTLTMLDAPLPPRMTKKNRFKKMCGPKTFKFLFKLIELISTILRIVHLFSEFWKK